MKPVRWQGAWLIRAPRDEVYALMTDFERWPQLMPGIVERARIVSRTDASVVEGASVVLEGDFNLLGQRGRGVMNIRLHPPEGFDAENTSEALGQESETVRFDEVPEGTRFRWTVDAKPNGFFIPVAARFIAPLIRWFYERTIIKPIRKALER